jgi:hypothetical protein
MLPYIYTSEAFSMSGFWRLPWQVYDVAISSKRALRILAVRGASFSGDSEATVYAINELFPTANHGNPKAWAELPIVDTVTDGGSKNWY